MSAVMLKPLVIRRGQKIRTLRDAINFLRADRPGMRKSTSRHPHTGTSIRKLSDAQMWELFDNTRAAYRKNIRRAHPDRGGDAALSVQINHAWAVAKKLFARKGFTA